MVSSSPRLVVVSVDGMPPAFYMRPDEFGLKVPNLRRLVAEARYAEAVETIYPSTTYPAEGTAYHTAEWTITPSELGGRGRHHRGD